MFVTILTIIYSAIALYIIARFVRENTQKVTIWANKVLIKYQKVIFGSRYWKGSDIEEKQVSDLRTEAKA
ncbi:hypothetical protein GCM10009122_58100 [Fulvivirga kasyanovii]